MSGSLKSRISNKDALIKIFKELFPTQGPYRLLEIASGTGDHALYIAKALPQLNWLTSELFSRHSELKKNLKIAKVSNVHGPIEFELGVDKFPAGKFQAVFASQLFHAISWKEAKSLFKMLGNRLRAGSLVLFYGSFKYDQKFLSEHFEQLDRSLKEKEPSLGIRSFEDILKAMTKAGFHLKRDDSLDDSNHLLTFERHPHQKLK